MTAFSGTFWSIFVALLTIPTYSAFQKNRYQRASQLCRSPLEQKQKEFRVSLVGYVPSLFFIIIGWCGVWQGIVRWVHAEPRYPAFLITGLILAFFGSGMSKALAYSSIRLSDNLLEYKYGRRSIKIQLNEISSVKMVASRFSNYILVATRNNGSIKIPLYFWNGPQLYAYLLAHHGK